MGSIVSRDMIKSMGFGLILMALFTLFWFGTAASNLSGNFMWILFAFTDLIAIVFIVYAIHLFLISKRFPQTQESDKTIRRKILTKFGLVFGLEGLTIAVCVLLLKRFNLHEFIIPAIATIVGLHFFPMSSIFQRKLDFYTASFATIVGLAGLLFTATKKNSSTDISIIVGIGIGIVTTFYGIYMIWTAQEQKNNQFAN